MTPPVDTMEKGLSKPNNDAMPVMPPSTDELALALMTGRVSAVGVLEQALNEIRAMDPWESPAKSAGLLVTAIAASQPQAITPAITTALLEVVRKADQGETWQPGMDEAFELLTLLSRSPAALTLPELLAEIVRSSALHPRWAARIVRLLTGCVEWNAAHLNLDSLLEIAEHLSSDMQRDLFHMVIEPVILSQPAALDERQFRRIVAIPGEPLVLRHLIATLATHQDTPAEVRAAAARLSAAWFPLRSVWQQIADECRHVICVQNIADSQGDEIVRVASLLQALLDSHPNVRVSLMTDRAYLYSHPRLEAISFDERDQIEQLLAQAPDVLIEFFEPDIRHLNYDLELAARLAALRQASQPLLDIQASKGWNWFGLDRVQIGGLDWARPLQLDQSMNQCAYDPVHRLILELGLPLRIGEQAPRSEPVLAGRSTPADDIVWRALTESNIEGRPIALFNPFGGGADLKGFVAAKFDDLRCLLRRVVDEGYFVVICPAGTPWGSGQLAEMIRSSLPEAHQSQVVIGPDPSPTANEQPSPDDSRRDPEIKETASDLMRRIIGFVARADLIITVEGWMMHAAYHFGKPYRLLMLPYSHGTQWHPWGRSAAQQVWLFNGDAGLDHPPLPEKPRKFAWLQLLERIDDPAWLAQLVEWATSPDVDIRAASARALGRIGTPEAVPHLARLIQDRSHRVRSSAAGALLTAYPSHAGRAGIPSIEQLELFRLINGERNNWALIEQRASHDDPALRAALHDTDPVVRREAAIVIEFMRRTTEADNHQEGRLIR